MQELSCVMAMEAIVEKLISSSALAFRFRAAPLGTDIKPIFTHVGAAVAAVCRVALEWARRARSRRELCALTPREIRDFCLDSMAVEREARKPFWRA
jgi:uncharacterized protein YjiS (DUF1127 family)